MSRAYLRGYFYERKLKGILSRKGWLVVRAARSAPVDLVALRGGRAVCIEVKKNGPKSAPREFLDLISAYQVPSVYVTVIGGLYYWSHYNLDPDLIPEFRSIFGPNIVSGGEA